MIATLIAAGRRLEDVGIERDDLRRSMRAALIELAPDLRVYVGGQERNNKAGRGWLAMVTPSP